jgi:Na+-transporting methylmalonyl-CoA/oxaloacetate decarboxylase gamma subunit
MINSITLLAQATGSSEAASGPGGVVVVGFLFVVLVLALLATVTSVMGAWFNKQAAHDAAKAAAAAQSAAEASAKSGSVSGAAAPAAPAASVASSGAPQDDADDPAFVALVAAAVHSVIGDRPHRIVSIRSSGPGWAQEGRRQIFSSHRVR